MTCNACGEKPKDTAKDFTKAVVEINNPETLVLLRKVVIPASMGTEEQVPAAIGKYHNVILHYEANKHTYLYSSDGIPTLLEMDVPQELINRIDDLEENLEQEIADREGMDEELQSNIDAVAQDLEDFKNSPDVVDIVPTYAALQAYDTSKLGDNDEIRVLTDETHDNASSYYRWDKTNSQWTFIGITGPYYTKSETYSQTEVNTLLDSKQNMMPISTALFEDNYPNSPGFVPNGISANTLPAGFYYNTGTKQVYFGSLSKTGNFSFLVIGNGNYSSGGGKNTFIVQEEGSDARPLLYSASYGNPGLVASDIIISSDLFNKNYKAVKIAPIGETAGSAFRSTAVGTDTEVGPYGTALGYDANASGSGSVSIGYLSRARSQNSVAINGTIGTGGGGNVVIGVAGHIDDNITGSISIGGAYISTQGVMSISKDVGDPICYNNTKYRLLTGLYDPQSAHDAATKGYVDPSTDTTAPTTSTAGRLGEIRIDTSTNTAYMCVSADSTSSTYTWKQITS